MAALPNALTVAAAKLAATFADYRIHDGTPQISHSDVLRWVQQFPRDQATQTAFLTELGAIYAKTYWRQAEVCSALGSLVTHIPFTGPDCAAFWSNVELLNIQPRGSSQSDLNVLLRAEVRRQLNVEIGHTMNPTSQALFVDDAIFSGNCIFNCLSNWITSNTGRTVQVVVLDTTDGGKFSLQRRLRDTVGVEPLVWSFRQTKNKRTAGSQADVYRLTAFPTDAASQRFAQVYLKGEEPSLLRGNSPNRSDRFSNEYARSLVEHMLWEAGLQCLEMCPNFPPNARPLGYCSAGGQNKLGFGSLFASYRNCPNNAPIALWAGEPWIPLLRRKTN